MRKCLRPQGAAGHFDGYCQLPAGHKGDCDETFAGLETDFISRQDYDVLLEEFYKLERTVYGIQQLLGKAAEYQGKPRGRLPR